MSFENVAIEKCPSYDYEVVKEALDKVLADIDALDFVKPGMRIGIKTNLVAAMAPDKSVTTHPVLLKRLCEKLLEMGASVVIGDSPGGLYTPMFLQNVYKTCGLETMVKELDPTGEKLKLNDDYSIHNGEFLDAVSIKTFIYTGWLDNVDAIINFSKLKTHAMMGMSCAVKNMFGTIPGATKPEYHMRFPEEHAFANIMVDLNEFFKPKLYVVDAVDGMEGNGPTAGEKRHIGAVLASARPYALDMVCAELIGMGYADVATLIVANERGLGPKDFSEVTVVGSCPISEIKVADFKRATIHQSITFEGKGIQGALTSAVLKLAYTTKPQVKVKECIGCRKCADTCPAKAITMVDGGKNKIPQIDRSKCIKCFCCQEFCPKGAMKVHYNLLGRFANRINHV